MVQTFCSNVVDLVTVACCYSTPSYIRQSLPFSLDANNVDTSVNYQCCHRYEEYYFELKMNFLLHVVIELRRR